MMTPVGARCGPLWGLVLLALCLPLVTCAPSGQLGDGACASASFAVRPARCELDPLPDVGAPEPGHDWLRDRPVEPPLPGDVDPPAMQGTPVPEPLEPGLPYTAF
jgi:hypothetical protein